MILGLQPAPDPLGQPYQGFVEAGEALYVRSFGLGISLTQASVSGLRSEDEP